MTRTLPLPPGPWMDEPTHLEFEHAGFRCAILRHRELGTLNGYVGIPEGHPWFRVVDTCCSDVDVHGGITYAEPRPPKDVPDTDGRWWWIGFDTGHAGDFMPATSFLLGRTEPHDGEVYRDLAYVRHETEQLAEQAAQVSGTPRGNRDGGST